MLLHLNKKAKYRVGEPLYMPDSTPFRSNAILSLYLVPLVLDRMITRLGYR
jgi:hypothetical protein